MIMCLSLGQQLEIHLSKYILVTHYLALNSTPLECNLNPFDTFAQARKNYSALILMLYNLNFLLIKINLSTTSFLTSLKPFGYLTFTATGLAFKQYRQCIYNETMRPVRATIVAVEKQ
jgi:hypothetical protein